MTKEKMISEIVKNAKIAGFEEITKEDTLRRYNEILEKHGEKKANGAMEYTLKQFKEKAKAAEKLFWNKVKWELFDKNKCVPSSIRDIKTGIKSGEIKIDGIESETKIKELLEIA